MLKSEELQKHDMVYGRDFLGIQRGDNINERIYNWKSRNGTLSAEDVQDLVVSNDFLNISNQYFVIFFTLKSL